MCFAVIASPLTRSVIAIYCALWLRGQNWYSTSSVVKLLHKKISRIEDVKTISHVKHPAHAAMFEYQCASFESKEASFLSGQTAGLFFKQGLETLDWQLTFLCSAVHLMHVLNWNDAMDDVDILYKAFEFDPVWQRANLPYQSMTSSNRDRHSPELFVSISLIFSELNGKRLLVDNNWPLFMSLCMPTEPAWRSCACFLKTKRGSCALWSPILVLHSFT